MIKINIEQCIFQCHCHIFRFSSRSIAKAISRLELTEVVKGVALSLREINFTGK